MKVTRTGDQFAKGIGGGLFSARQVGPGACIPAERELDYTVPRGQPGLRLARVLGRRANDAT